jgi:hypothetical protein
MTYSNKMIGLAVAAISVGLTAAYLTFMPAQAQGPVAMSAAECVTYGSGSALQMCLHKFTDGTRCVAAGGGGLASAGAGAALQCDFK